VPLGCDGNDRKVNVNNDSALDRMVRILQERGPFRAGDLGAEMWLRHEQRYNDDAGRRHCRAAGKMLHRAKALGLVRDEQKGPNHLWFAVEKGGDTPTERRS